jgi:isopenicillin N synthase-like dioxygenase
VQAHQFFALPPEHKEVLHVRNGGRAWRGWMPFGGELTKGRTDRKEGLYLGPEHLADHPRCVGGYIITALRMPGCRVREEVV